MKPDPPVVMPNYYSFLLRLWRVGDGTNPIWRATLQNVQSGVSYTFADLCNLAAFLNERRWEELLHPGDGSENSI